MTGINYDNGSSTVSGNLNNLPAFTSLDLYYTTATSNMVHVSGIPVVNGSFSASVPGNSVFTLTGFVPAAVAIVAQPTNQVVKSGGMVTLSVQATGTSALTYQWQRNGVNVAGATNSSLTLTNVQVSTSHIPLIYRVIVKGTGTSLTSSNATILVDQKNPTITISSPGAGARLTNGTVNVVGKASDDTQVAAVFYQINGSSWTPTTGASNWTASVNLTAGSNWFRVYSVDGVGNHSTTNSLAITFVVDLPLTLITNGLGGITGKTNGTMLEIGKVYTVTATPKAGQVFSNWVGSVVSGTAILSFVMQSNMVLQANFIPNPFPPAAGTYYGLFSETNRVHSQSGFFTLTFANSGSYSARLQIGTTNYSTSGMFTVAGTATQSIARRGTTPLTLTMSLDLVGGQFLEGTVSSGGWLADLTAERAVFDSKTNPATQYLGKYNLMIPGGEGTGTTFPEGDSYATVNVDASGKLTVSGSLADNSALSQSVPISGSGDWAVYVPLYNGGGSLLGWLSFDTNSPADGLDGWLNWIKPAQRTTYYPGGFTNSVMAGASRYTAPIGNTNQVIPLTNGVLIVEGGNFQTPLTNMIFMSISNKITDGSLSNKLSLSLTISNGIFKGSITPKGTARALTIQGAIYQDLGAGYGYCLGTNQASRVYFGP